MRNPEVIYIETTNCCNANCIMCPHDKMVRRKEVMHDEIYNKIVEGLKFCDLTKTQVFLHKEGEPLCDNKLISRIKYLSENNPEIKELGINTNAMLLTKEKSRELIESGLNLIFFSLDGATSESYEKIRVNCKYDVVVENVKYFLELRKKSNKKIRVVMQMLLFDFNMVEKEDYIKMWSQYDVEFYFKETHCYLDGGQSSFAKPVFQDQIKICEDPFKVLVYYVDGNVGCCCWDYNNEYVVGNVSEGNALELFNNNRIDFLRTKQKGLDCGEIKPCNRCGRIYGEDRISKY